MLCVYPVACADATGAAWSVTLVPLLTVVCLSPRPPAPANALTTEDCRGVQFDQGQFCVTNAVW